MDILHPRYYFDLSKSSFVELFEHADFVWQALSQMKTYLSQRNLGKISSPINPGVILDCPELINIGKGCQIEPGAYIRGPCIIEDHCIIRHGAYIRGGVMIGKSCVVGHCTEIKDSLLLDGAKAPHFAYVGNSILGLSVNLGAGVKLANVKLDKEPVSIYVQDKKIETGLKKLGAIIGDFAQIGCNSVTNPGTLIAPRAMVLPCHSVKGIIFSRPLEEEWERMVVSKEELGVPT